MMLGTEGTHTIPLRSKPQPLTMALLVLLRRLPPQGSALHNSTMSSSDNVNPFRRAYVNPPLHARWPQKRTSPAVAKIL